MTSLKTKKVNHKINILDLFYANFFVQAKATLSSDYLAEYAVLYFIKEIRRNKNHIYSTIEETVNKLIYLRLSGCRIYQNL